MTIGSSLSVAFKALGRNKLQTFLTMIGMTIGVATVLTMIALGSGAEAAISDQVRAAGMNLIVVTAGNFQMKREKGPDDAIEPASFRRPRRKAEQFLRTALWSSSLQPRLVLAFHPEDDPMEKHDHPTARQRLGDSEAGLGAAATLTAGDADAIRKIKGVQYVSEGVHENAHVIAGSNRWFTRLHGDDTSLPMIRRAWVFSEGRFFNRSEQVRADEVIVLGNVVSRKLFGNESAVGKTVNLWKQSFKVVGVVGSGSWMVAAAPGDDQFDAVYVPFTTVHRLLNLSKLNDITITTSSTGDVSRVSKQISDLMRVRHKIGPKTPDDFTVTSQAKKALARGGMRPEVAEAVVGNVAGLEKVTLAQLGKTLDRASKTMTALLCSIAGVSLLVGGIGIMNVMLLSVTERTREIGIRRAVGARAKDVLLQFLMEAITLSLCGGVLGVLIGLVVSGSVAQFVQWSVSVSPMAILVSFGIAAAVGIFFGFYPARQASQVEPIECLRYE